MDINCLASSSAGNCYVIRNDRHSLMIEAGIKVSRMVPALMRLTPPILLTNLKGVLVTHSHGDHALEATKVGAYGVPVFASMETIKSARIRSNPHLVGEWEPDVDHMAGSFAITAFSVEHDCPGSIGFIVRDTISNERLLFINDARVVEWDLSGFSFDHVMIECNYCPDILIRNNDEHAIRVAKSHMSLQTTLLTLKKLNLSNTRGIYLMHLSDGNSNQEYMLQEVRRQTGRPTYACLKDGGIAQ